MNPIAIISVIAGIAAAFVGAYLAKRIELQNEFGDYYYFLKKSRKAKWYCGTYGVVGTAFLLLISYSDVISKDYVPDYNFAAMQGLASDSPALVSVFYIMGTSFLVGFTSKGILDMPIAKARATDETHFKVKDIIAFLFPEVKKSFQNIIRSNEIDYFNKTTQGIQQQDVKIIAKKVYDWLKDKIDWKSDEKQRELDVLMNSLKQVGDSYEALRYLYRNLGREEFEFAFGLKRD